jgi:hypothetical protein
MIYHTVSYTAGKYGRFGKYTKHVEEFTLPARYEHKNRRSLVRYAQNAAFDDAVRKGFVFEHLYCVDGNAA